MIQAASSIKGEAGLRLCPLELLAGPAPGIFSLGGRTGTGNWP